MTKVWSPSLNSYVKEPVCPWAVQNSMRLSLSVGFWLLIVNVGAGRIAAEKIHVDNILYDQWWGQNQLNNRQKDKQNTPLIIGNA